MGGVKIPLFCNPPWVERGGQLRWTGWKLFVLAILSSFGGGSRRAEVDRSKSHLRRGARARRYLFRREWMFVELTTLPTLILCTGD